MSSVDFANLFITSSNGDVLTGQTVFIDTSYTIGPDQILIDRNTNAPAVLPKPTTNLLNFALNVSKAQISVNDISAILITVATAIAGGVPNSVGNPWFSQSDQVIDAKPKSGRFICQINGTDLVTSGIPDSIAEFKTFNGFFQLIRFQIDGSTIPFTETPTVILSTIPACFQKGTHILTPEGEKTVELLRAGDLVISAKTGRSVPIKAMLRFFGNQTNCPLYCLPKAALGENKPTRDLFLSHRHRVSLDGQLRHMVCLADMGKSVPTGKAHIEYYHIELADCFDTVIAEGVEVETFIDPRVVRHDWKCTSACCTYIPIGPQPTLNESWHANSQVCLRQGV